jgi:uncharacterized protein (DUF1778 family)
MMGRPPKPKGEVKSAFLRIRMTKTERALLDRAAKSQGEETSTWARAALVALANKLLAR